MKIICKIWVAWVAFTLAGALPVAAIEAAFVSISGVDSNPCTKLSPCRTITQAYFVTNIGGTITMLDDGEYEAAALNGTITLQGQGPGTVISGDGPFGLNLGEGAQVVLRDFSIDHRSQTAAGYGIRFYGQSMIVENVSIRDQHPAGTAISIETTMINSYVHLSNVKASIVSVDPGTVTAVGLKINVGSGGTHRVVVENGSFDLYARGVVVQGSADVHLSLSNTTVSNSTGNGMEIGKSGGTTKLTIKDSEIINNGGTGLLISPTGSAKVNTTAMNSAFDANVIGIRSFPGGSAVSNLTISDTSASNNAGGIHASGKSVVSIIRGAIGGNSSYGVAAVSPAAVRIGSSVVSGNTLGFSGPISSYGNNQLHGNTNIGSTSPLPPSGMP